jgi:hypothetical protein
MTADTRSGVMYCENCGAEIAADAIVCAKCGYEVSGDGESTTAFQPQPSDPKPRIAGTQIVLGDGETVWREYAVTQFPAPEILGMHLSRHRGSGSLYVTDSRVLFFATYERRGGRKRSIILQETQVEHVTGVTAFVSRSVSLWGLVIVGLIGLFGLIALLEESTGPGIALLLIAAFGAFLLTQGLGRRGTVGVRIHSGATQASPLGFGQLGESRGRLRAMLEAALGPYGQLLSAASGPQDASDLLMALPGPDAERVIVELGALIADLQSKGSLAGTHWGVHS